MLCTLGYLPGLLHAWYIISVYPEPTEYDYETLDPESAPSGGRASQGAGRLTYYYVNRTEGSGEGLNAQGRPVVYGTVAGIPAQQPKPQEPPRVEAQNQSGGEGSAGAEGVPPSYDQVIAGDNKVQR